MDCMPNIIKALFIVSFRRKTTTRSSKRKKKLREVKTYRDSCSMSLSRGEHKNDDPLTCVLYKETLLYLENRCMHMMILFRHVCLHIPCIDDIGDGGVQRCEKRVSSRLGHNSNDFGFKHQSVCCSSPFRA